MNGVKIKDIRACLPEKENPMCDCGCGRTGDLSTRDRIRNSTIDEIGEIALTLNREKLAKELFECDYGQPDVAKYKWEDAIFISDRYYFYADRIISNQRKLLEVVK